MRPLYICQGKIIDGYGLLFSQLPPWWIEIVNLVVFLNCEFSDLPFVHPIKKTQHSNYYNNNDSFTNLNLSCTLVLKLETHSPPSKSHSSYQVLSKTISRVDLNFPFKKIYKKNCWFLIFIELSITKLFNIFNITVKNHSTLLCTMYHGTSVSATSPNLVEVLPINLTIY